MRDDWPIQLKREAQALEARIREAFKGVSREGGVSWSESVVIDLPEVSDLDFDQQRMEARARDLDTSWEQLIDDPAWFSACGIGGFPFLDAIGFRYYLPVALIRTVRDRSDSDQGICFHLDIPPEAGWRRAYCVEHVSLLNRAQCQTVAAFLRFMNSVPDWPNPCLGDEWDAALRSHWTQFEP